MDVFIKPFRTTGIADVAEVGGKNAALGELINALSGFGINTPDGFSVTVRGFQFFLRYNDFGEKLRDILRRLDCKTYGNLNEVSDAARALVLQGRFPPALQRQIIEAYDKLSAKSTKSVAVRSSATAEDLPNASFAGQHDSFLNVNGHRQVLESVRKCYASLYNARAIKYRDDRKIAHDDVFISAGIQLMIDASRGCSGIGFTLDPESGFRDAVHLSGSWGLGENIVQGNVTPDEFIIFKHTLLAGKDAILSKSLGSKRLTMWYGKGRRRSQTINKRTPLAKSARFVLNDAEISKLAAWMVAIENHFGRPMDIEWAKDGHDDNLYILQARPETVHSRQRPGLFKSYKLLEKGEVITTGKSVGRAIASGRARILTSPSEAGTLQSGDILVTDTATPDWDPIMKRVSGIVTNTGGRTSHAAIVARELGLVGIFGAGNATATIQDGDLITLNCASGETGIVYRGQLHYKELTLNMDEVDLPNYPKAQLILSEPEKAFALSAMPNHGVGLLRIEFIISSLIGIHPMAIAHPELIPGHLTRRKISGKSKGYESTESFFVETLSRGIGMVAAAFYPKEVIVRMSDFKSSEYSGLLGGEAFEPLEENPMIGFRGASRYDHDRYRDGFLLECRALSRVRDEMGFHNVKIMIPFCRTVPEGKAVLDLMRRHGLERKNNGLDVYVMAEIPSNIVEAPEFAKHFDGFSIGSNDLTQLTLGIDRDSEILANQFKENDPAVTKLIASLISDANRLHRKVGLCGQAASDSKDFVRFLVHAGIDSISFNPDALLDGIKHINAANASRPKLTVVK